MTPAIKELESANVEFTVHRYDNQVAHGYAEEAASSLGINPATVCKTLVTEDQQQNLYVAIVPATQHLNLKKLAAIVGAKKMKMADPTLAERSTGYLTGGISPLGQKTRLPTYAHISLTQFTKINVSGGRRGLEIELSANNLIELCSAHVADIC
jgi:Cys-tRNA(Pro)/Cys-tRNA(Cys) deacylase